MIDPTKSWKENLGKGSWKSVPDTVRWNSGLGKRYEESVSLRVCCLKVSEHLIEAELDTVHFKLFPVFTERTTGPTHAFVDFKLGTKHSALGNFNYTDEDLVFGFGTRFANLTKYDFKFEVSFEIKPELEHELQAVYSGTETFNLKIDEQVSSGKDYPVSVEFSFKGNVVSTSAISREDLVVFDLNIRDFAVDGDGIFLDFIPMHMGVKDKAEPKGSIYNLETNLDVSLGFIANTGRHAQYYHSVSFLMATEIEYTNTQWNRTKKVFGDWDAEDKEIGNQWTPDNPETGGWN